MKILGIILITPFAIVALSSLIFKMWNRKENDYSEERLREIALIAGIIFWLFIVGIYILSV